MKVGRIGKLSSKKSKKEVTNSEVLSGENK